MMKKRLMILLCCLVVLVQLLPIVPMAEMPENSWEKVWGSIPEELYYCREQLKKLENSDALLFAYDNIVAGIDACAEEIVISNNRYQISPDEFEMVLEATRRDHTEQFWMGTSYTPYTNYDETVMQRIVPTYLMSGSQLQDAQVAFEQVINNFLARLTPDMNEYEKEKALHDMLAMHITYKSSNNSHNAYGALVEGKAVCEGYAEALQCLLQRVGIQSVEVFGYGINPSTQKGEPHAWNAVRIGGQYYLVDLTWNDQDVLLSYAYFNQTSAILDEDHRQWRVGHKADGSELSCQVFSLPVCTATAANYYVKNSNFRISNYTAESIGKLLKNNNMSVSLYITKDPLAFEEWYNTNCIDIAKAAGLTGAFTYGTVVIGREVRIFMNTCTHTRFKLVEAKDATCSEDGNTAYYVCQNSQCGKWFTIEKDNKGEEYRVEIYAKESVKIFSIGHNWERKIDETTRREDEDETYWYTCSVCNEKSTTEYFTLEPEGHVCEEVGIFEIILNAIINFFRMLFGLPEICTCGEVIDYTIMRATGPAALSFFFCNMLAGRQK